MGGQDYSDSRVFFSVFFLRFYYCVNRIENTGVKTNRRNSVLNHPTGQQETKLFSSVALNELNVTGVYLSCPKTRKWLTLCQMTHIDDVCSMEWEDCTADIIGHIHRQNLAPEWSKWPQCQLQAH